MKFKQLFQSSIALTAVSSIALLCLIDSPALLWLSKSNQENQVF